MQGHDNIIAAGEDAFTTLHSTIDYLGEAGQTEEWTQEHKQMLDVHLLYQKGDFKTHF